MSGALPSDGQYPPPPVNHQVTADAGISDAPPAYNPAEYAGHSASEKHDYPAGQQHAHSTGGEGSGPALPPRRYRDYKDDDPSNPVHYTRDPHKLIAYLVPFPKPQLKGVPPENIPDRFLIYTPPPPPLSKPAEGEKENKIHKLQRKWQEEVREAKTSTAKTASWKGVKSKATKGISWAMSQTVSSNLEFLNRIGATSDDDNHNNRKPATSSGKRGSHSDDEVEEDATTKKTVGLSEMIMVHPHSIPGTEDQIREEFVNSMLRSKSKAQKDAVIATGLLPVGFAIDILLTFVWPFGGLAEIDAVWMASSIRGAKTARSTTKRLTSSSSDGKHEEDQLKLTFRPSPRLEVLRQYLAAQCHQRDAKMFRASVSPTESEVLEAIGWSPSQTGGEGRNWEDEAWETSEVKEDLRAVMGKGGREWVKWCKAFEKDPEKALKK